MVTGWGLFYKALEELITSQIFVWLKEGKILIVMWEEKVHTEGYTAPAYEERNC